MSEDVRNDTPADEGQPLSYNLPLPPSGEELAAVENREAYEPYLLSLQEQFEDPVHLLEYKGVGFSSIGDLQAVTGHQKNGKTFLLAQLMAAILEPDSEHLRAKLPGLTMTEEARALLPDGATVLYVDTEQTRSYTARVARRVHWLCDWELQQDHKRFKVLFLRAEEDVEKRWKAIEAAMWALRPTAVFIDGIRDLINDFNDLGESSELIHHCMSLADTLHCCIWSVLHENPGTEKMRGHLGTELGNKVSDTFVCKKEKKGSQVTFTVSQKDARGRDVEDWVFEITDDAGALGIPRLVDAAEKDAETRKEIADLRILMRTLLLKNEYWYTELIDRMKKHRSELTQKEAVRLWKLAVKENMIINISTDPKRQKFTYNKSYDELQYNTRNNDQSLPF